MALPGPCSVGKQALRFIRHHAPPGVLPRDRQVTTHPQGVFPRNRQVTTHPQGVLPGDRRALALCGRLLSLIVGQRSSLPLTSTVRLRACPDSSRNPRCSHSSRLGPSAHPVSLCWGQRCRCWLPVPAVERHCRHTAAAPTTPICCPPERLGQQPSANHSGKQHRAPSLAVGQHDHRTGTYRWASFRLCLTGSNSEPWPGSGILKSDQPLPHTWKNRLPHHQHGGTPIIRLRIRGEASGVAQ